MVGGAMQLFSYGAEDLYLTGNPVFSYWKQVYKRYTNFATQCISLEMEKKPNFSPRKSARINCKLKKNGDLITDCYLVVDIPQIYSDVRSAFKWKKYLGYIIMRSAQINISGQIIDTQYGDWMAVWNELTLPQGKKHRYDQLIGNSPDFNVYSRGSYEPDIENVTPNTFDYSDSNIMYLKKRLYIPLDFWFCKNWALALPLIAITNPPIITFEISSVNDWFTIGSGDFSPDEFFEIEDNKMSKDDRIFRNRMIEANLNADNIWFYFISPGLTTFVNNWNENIYVEGRYIFLDKDEKNYFAKLPHIYLITQTQKTKFSGLKAGYNEIKPRFNYPVKEIFYWLYKENRDRDLNFTQNKQPEVFDYFNESISNQVNTMHYAFNLEQGGLISITDITRIFLNSLYVYSLASILLDSNKMLANDVNNFNDNINNILQSSTITINEQSNDIFDNNFFENVQQYKYHTNSSRIRNVYSYSFALYPEKNDPSGSFNLSKAKKIIMKLNLKPFLQVVNFDETYGLTSVMNDLTKSSESFINKFKHRPPQIQINPDGEYNINIYALNYNLLNISGGTAFLSWGN